MRDVADRAGVSVMTVSRVVNGQPTVDRELARRVNAVAAELGFEPNRVARTLRSGSSTATIGLIIEDLANPFYSRIARVVEEYARREGALLIASSSQEDPRREQELALELFRHSVAGILIVPAAGDHSYLSAPIARSTPVVFIDRPGQSFPADTIVIDNFGGAKAGTERLIAAGHQRIAVLGFTLDTFTIAERIRGYRAAMAEAGLPVDESLIRLGVLREEEASSHAAALINAGDPPTAFFCTNNVMTLGVVEELQRRNLRLDVVGFDEISFAKYLPLPVTYVTYDIDELARSAADVLFRRIAGDATPIETRTLPTLLRTFGN